MEDPDDEDASEICGVNSQARLALCWQRHSSLMRYSICDEAYLWHSSHLTEFMDQMVLESQRPYKIVDLLFTITYENKKLTFGGGVDVSKLFG